MAAILKMAVVTLAITLTFASTTPKQREVPTRMKYAMFRVDFFHDEISTIRLKLEFSAKQPPNFEHFRGDTMSVFRPLTEDEVRKIIKSSPAKSCCLDPIPTPL
ncbi:hypothetical protein ElyMa_002497000 [Elysia marginata]|uniref:Selenoprotein F/M domain-containing protein n=1 Tax=Elysia marginata TaxID=1093978 RepID=A0AAV4GP95_9GAST|nr:hypothetical protein ElyMa_002497000 [Elysia marginata]